MKKYMRERYEFFCVLREYSKTEPEIAIKFVEKADISNFSKKEALKRLKNKDYLK